MSTTIGNNNGTFLVGINGTFKHDILCSLYELQKNVERLNAFGTVCIFHLEKREFKIANRGFINGLLEANSITYRIPNNIKKIKNSDR